MTEAEGYILLATHALPLIAESRWELRNWWATEAPARRRYGLTKEQEDELAEQCRVWIAVIPEGGPPGAPEKTPLRSAPRAAGPRAAAPMTGGGRQVRPRPKPNSRFAV